MPRQASEASLLSIARTLGLSTATVSNAFNRPERVSAGTLARIHAEAERKGYAGPDPAARQLRRGRADAIGLVLTDELPFAFEDHAAVGFLAGVAQSCQESGRSLVMLASTATTNPPLGAVAIDGLIIYSVADGEPLLTAGRARRVPMVVVDQPHADPGWDWVGIDDHGVGRVAGEHLARLGHRSVGVLAPRLSRTRRNGPWPADEEPAYAVLRERITGLRAALAPHGGHAAAIPIEERTISSERAGATGLQALMSRHPELTAVFCLSDELALGALARAAELGIDVPRQLSIVGVDDIERAEAAGLTTIEQPLQAKGAVAGRLLMSRIEERLAGRKRAPAQTRTLPTTLHVRSTTAPPRRIAS
ncbi:MULTISPECIES: LacI family DNA-binding transcriptional regulator [Microbacterium]|uniref:LacI family DNA-binding transcriptional regulator n=1 Tax=Microbacterium dauci TaxID=3048008 RepID=A0ABT6ZC32_9MICO|nr:LacI family DNA-binding transcriptional regulator [Microbacterium sp. LX3-4]MDJ1113265.1 LacI family DNA-binding transcriptional regulator [Microbacterium sp. LX3-4]